METTLITTESYRENGILPKRGKSVLVSDNGVDWSKSYFVQIDDKNRNNPFLCVDAHTLIEFPYSKGIRWSMMKMMEYTIDDIILMNGSFKTRDGMYITEVDRNSGYSYWQYTSKGREAGVEFVWNHKASDFLHANEHGIDKALLILNKHK
jgi:hypothetical protein